MQQTAEAKVSHESSKAMEGKYANLMVISHKRMQQKLIGRDETLVYRTWIWSGISYC